MVDSERSERAATVTLLDGAVGSLRPVDEHDAAGRLNGVANYVRANDPDVPDVAVAVAPTKITSGVWRPQCWATSERLPAATEYVILLPISWPTTTPCSMWCATLAGHVRGCAKAPFYMFAST